MHPGDSGSLRGRPLSGEDPLTLPYHAHVPADSALTCASLQIVSGQLHQFFHPHPVPKNYTPPTYRSGSDPKPHWGFSLAPPPGPRPHGSRLHPPFQSCAFHGFCHILFSRPSTLLPRPFLLSNPASTFRSCPPPGPVIPTVPPTYQIVFLSPALPGPALSGSSHPDLVSPAERRL